MKTLDAKITTRRIESRQFKRSKYVNTWWYQFFGYNRPFSYLFRLLEKLKLIHKRPWKVTEQQTVICNFAEQQINDFLRQVVEKHLAERE